MVKIKCPFCGVIGEVDEAKEAAVCAKCGEAFVVTKAFENFKSSFGSVLGVTPEKSAVITSKNVEKEPEECSVYFLCPQCGTELFEGDLFCYACGFHLADVNDTGADAKTVDSEAVGPKSKEVLDIASENRDEVSEQVSMPLLCPQCGAELFDGDHFCYACGFSLFPINEDAADEKVAEPEPMESELEETEQAELSTVGHCAKCGGPLYEGDLFCSACGIALTVAEEPIRVSIGDQKLDIDETVETTTQEETKKENPVPVLEKKPAVQKTKKSKPKKWLLPAIIGGIVAVMTATLVFTWDSFGAVYWKKLEKSFEYDEWMVIKEPTCTEKGLGKWVNDWGQSKEEEISMLEHQYSRITITEATCSEPGVQMQVCSVCGYGVYNEIPAKGHVWKEATCTLPRTCSNCNKTDGKALGHSYSEGVCTRCSSYQSKGLVVKNGELTSVGTCKDSHIYIPRGVQVIGLDAFSWCTNLKSVTIPDSVTSIGDYAFFGCTNLTNITLPNSVTRIGFGAFNECRGLTSVALPNSVSSIGDWAFKECGGLLSITIPNSVTSIGDSVFSECTNLKNIVIPNSVLSIGHAAFYQCDSLISIKIPNSVTSIGDYAFFRCTSLTSITIPNSVESIGDSAFRDCSSLTTILFDGTETEWHQKKWSTLFSGAYSIRFLQ